MSPITHFLGSWLVATAATTNARDRKLVTLAGILPDLDGLGIVADMAVSIVSGKESSFHYYQHYHHYLLHGWPGAFLVTALLVCFARQHWRVGLLCLLMFHLHLICDFIGSRGPTPSDIWPINYSEPLYRAPMLFWKGQWRLDGWQNRVISLILVLSELGLAARRGYSCVEVFSSKADAVFVAVLQKWLASFSRKNVSANPLPPKE